MLLIYVCLGYRRIEVVVIFISNTLTIYLVNSVSFRVQRNVRSPNSKKIF